MNILSNNGLRTGTAIVIPAPAISHFEPNIAFLYPMLRISLAIMGLASSIDPHTVPGTAAGVGSAGLGRMKSIGGWHINAADASWRKRLVGYKAKFGSTTNMDLILPYRTMDVLAAAINTAGTAEPTKVALALEGMKYNGFTGPTWMRAEDHQIMAPLYILSLAKAGQPPVESDEEGSGYGWKTEAFFEAKDTVPPMKCKMERP